MTSPFTQTKTGSDEDKIWVPLGRCRGKLLIVRPLEYQREGFTTKHKPEGTDVVFADVAVLDEIPAKEDDYGNELPGYPAGTQFRNQAILQGYLKGAFKRHIGDTLIGTVYFGVAEKGKPPIMWQDLSQDAEQVARGQRFLNRFPEFLVPQRAEFAESKPQETGPSAPPPVAAGADPWEQPSNGAAKGANTLEQLRQMGQMNHHNQPQVTDAPF